MAYEDNTKTNVRETVRTTESSSNSMPLIVGGLVVAVGFILWLVFGSPGPISTSEPASNTTNVTIEPPAAPADSTTNTTIDPAPAAPNPEPVAPATGDAPAAAAPATPPANP
ncbi:MAG: hypothetical protein FD150_1333 [Rhodobacteraceae bacterium]|nr:MAG: hypothetical protein FD150_1333 [Paracoccaceae bacterium]